MLRCEVSYRGIPVLHLPLVMVGPPQGAASVELDVELVGVGPGPVDVHTVVIVSVAWRQTEMINSPGGDNLVTD